MMVPLMTNRRPRRKADTLSGSELASITPKKWSTTIFPPKSLSLV
jgi:hypothetical protein